MVKLIITGLVLLLSMAAQAVDTQARWYLMEQTLASPFKSKISNENGRWIVSESVLLELPGPEAALSVKGGELSVNGGEFSAAPQRIKQHDQVRVRLVTNSEWLKQSHTTITLDKTSVLFSVLLADSSPDHFTFTEQSDVARSTQINSNTVTITGIDTATPVSITGGYYRIDGGAWTQAAGTINVNQTLQLYVMSSASYYASTTATVTVGDYSTGFTVTTAESGSGGGGYDSGGGGGYGGGGSGGLLLILLAAVSVCLRRLRY